MLQHKGFHGCLRRRNLSAQAASRPAQHGSQTCLYWTSDCRWPWIQPVGSASRHLEEPAVRCTGGLIRADVTTGVLNKVRVR